MDPNGHLLRFLWKHKEGELSVMEKIKVHFIYCLEDEGVGLWVAVAWECVLWKHKDGESSVMEKIQVPYEMVEFPLACGFTEFLNCHLLRILWKHKEGELSVMERTKVP